MGDVLNTISVSLPADLQFVLKCGHSKQSTDNCMLHLSVISEGYRVYFPIHAYNNLIMLLVYVPYWNS
jgi:hypothetical protein